MSSRLLTGLGYLVVALALVASDLLARRTDSSIPTFGALVRWTARRRSAQLGLVFLWWWLGWHFLLGA